LCGCASTIANPLVRPCAASRNCSSAAAYKKSCAVANTMKSLVKCVAAPSCASRAPSARAKSWPRKDRVAEGAHLPTSVPLVPAPPFTGPPDEGPTMTTKTKTLFRAAAPRPEESQTGPWNPSPCSTEECLQRIQALNARINGYVEYIVKVDNLTGTSAE